MKMILTVVTGFVGKGVRMRRVTASLTMVLIALSIQAQNSIKGPMVVPFLDLRGGMIFQVGIGGKVCIAFVPQKESGPEQGKMVRGITFGNSDQHIIIASIRGAKAKDLPQVPK